jgi:inner membrane protein
VLSQVDSLTPEVDPDGKLEIRYKTEETPVTLAAKKSYLGRVYLDWAKYPIVEAESLQAPEEGWIVRFQDLRFVAVANAFGRQGGRRVLGAAVKIDKNLHVVGDVSGDADKQVVVPEPDQQ